MAYSRRSHPPTDIVADEDQEETTPTEKQLNYLEPDQKQELLSLFEDVIAPVPWSVSLLQHAINTKDSPSLKTAPYCLAPT